MPLTKERSRRADYGQDAPGVVRNLLGIGGIFLAVGLAGFFLRSPGAKSTAISIGISGTWFIFTGLLMVLSSRVGKLRARDRLLDGLRLQGNETLLDIGCGRGLLLIGAAKRLPRGKAIGIDMWSNVDLGGNRREATLANAVAEDVEDRVEVHDGDMRQLPFSDGTMDAVVASFSIHNIYDRGERRRAISEIARVLKPGGRVALMDMRHVREYADDLIAAGLTDVRVSGLSFLTFPLSRTVTATNKQ